MDDALFQAALKRTLAWEGGWSDDPADPGGETYCGISRRNWPNWPGWQQVDRMVGTGAMQADADIQAQVAAFYLENFWTPLEAGSWRKAGLAEDVFDSAANQGVRAAVKTLQLALGLPAAAQDGIVGPRTLAAIQIAPPTARARFGALRALRYAETVRADPEQARYLGGWLRRALAFALVP